MGRQGNRSTTGVLVSGDRFEQSASTPSRDQADSAEAYDHKRPTCRFRHGRSLDIAAKVDPHPSWSGSCVGKAVPSNVPEAPKKRPVPLRIVKSQAVSLIPGVLVGVDPPSKVPLNASAPKSTMKVPNDAPPPSERQVLVLWVKLPSEDEPIVLDGSMTERNDSGAQVGSAPTRVLTPVTLPLNGRTSAFAGKASTNRLQAIAVRKSFRIFLSSFLAVPESTGDDEGLAVGSD